MMTESIKFGPEWLRNSVANVVATPASQPQPHSQQQAPQSPATDSIISRPVLSDHRYGREEMLSLCDKSARLPDALPRFRRLFVAEWQTPLALTSSVDEEQIGARGLGGTGTPPWGTHIRPLMPAMGGRGTGMIRGGAIERGRGRGRGLYHGTGYTRSTSLYDEEGRRWLDRNGSEPAAEWSAASAVSPRKEGFSRSALESWRKGTRDENEEGWRSSSNGGGNGTNGGGGNGGGPPAREKWTRSTSWRDGTDNSIQAEGDGRPNGTSQLLNSSASPTSGGGGGSMRAPIAYKKSWDEDSNLPEWATESFDYGGTFDASGAFHDSERRGEIDDERGGRQRSHQHHQQPQPQPQQQQQQPQNHENHEEEEVDVVVVQNSPPPPPQQQPAPQPTKLMMDFLSENSQPPPQEKPSEVLTNGPTVAPAPIAQMDKMVENFVAHLIMDDDTGGGSVKQSPSPPIEWFYRDPQGDTQGPFSSADMSEWYKAGYFQESLMVRRSIDNTFVPLGQLVKVFGALRPFVAATIDGGAPIPQPPPPQTAPPVMVEPLDQFRLQRMATQQQPQQPPPPQAPPADVNNWSLMTAEQRMFLMQLAHQRQPPAPTPATPHDPYALKIGPAPPQAAPLDMRRMMGASDFFPAPTPVAPPAQHEPDPLQQLIMQIQMQQKTGGAGDAAQQQQQWIKPAPMMQANGGPMDLSAGLGAMAGGPQQQQQQGGGGGGGGGVTGNGNVSHPSQSSAAHWNATPLPIWDMSGGGGGNNSGLPNNVLKDQSQQAMQQQHHMQEMHQQQQQQQQQHQQQQQNQQQQQQPPEPDIIQNGVAEVVEHQHQHQQQHQQHQQQQQMQKVESKKKKKEVKEQQQQQQQNQQQNQKEPPKKQQQQQKEANEKRKPSEKKREERSTQPAAPAPWVGLQQAGASLSKIQKTEAQRRAVEQAAAAKEREHAKLEARMTEVREAKWNVQAPAGSHVKTLDEIQAEEQTAAEREAAMARREKKEAPPVAVDIWSTGAHSMAWQQPKAWAAGGGQSSAGFWEDPVKPAPSMQPKQPQMLSKSQTMATITTAKKQQQQQQQQQQQMQAQMQQQQQQARKVEKKPVRSEKQRKDEVNNEFTQWCTRTLSAMNGNVDVPTFVSFLQDIESPFEVKDYIKMYLGETKECTEFAKQFLERRSKQRNQQRLQNAHIDDMCSPAPAINPQANNSSGDFQEVKGKNKKVKAKKVMKAVDNRILGFTATAAPDRINVGDRDYGDA